MKTKTLQLIAVGWPVLFIFSCLTINIYFPEAEVKKTAEEIVGEIRKSDEDKEKKDKNLDEHLLNQTEYARNSAFSLIPAAFAGQEVSTVSSPKIRALKDSLKARQTQLKPFYDGGHIGEGNDGFINIRDDSGLNLRDKALLRSLEKEENSDRKSLYEEVARALEIDSSQISRVQKIFSEEWIKNARPGWWIQKQNGEWVRKQ